MSRNTGGFVRVDLSGKVALVTGATRGLGWEIAAGLASDGADVIVSSRRQDACEKAEATLSELTGRRTLAHACHTARRDDITSPRRRRATPSWTRRHPREQRR